VRPSREGGTELLLPPSAGDRGPAPKAPVFYNAAMAADRDLSVAVADALAQEGRQLRAWEMLAATGVRGLRVLNESTLFGSLLLTERNPDAFSVLETNARTLAGKGAQTLRFDAHELAPGAPFDWVDLDPYGSPQPFESSLFGAMSQGSILAVTATDMRVLASVDRATCERRYGARGVPGRLGPEGGLRILLAWLDRSAGERSLAIRPLLGYVRDHHVRAYVRLDARTDGAARPIAVLRGSEFPGPRLPGEGPYGPFWLGSLFEEALVRKLVVPPTAAHAAEVAALIGRFQGEATIDAPFFYESNELARSLGLGEPPPVDLVLTAIRDAGWPAARTHVRTGAFRTTAPRSEVERAARTVAAGRRGGR
jgi:tRNA (guanine26-N2/guanine27-N2)-dimethyltransferase